MVNQKAAVCNYQATSMGRIACTGVGGVALGDKLGRSSGVDGNPELGVVGAECAFAGEERAGG
jgi:hypothetical protein